MTHPDLVSFIIPGKFHGPTPNHITITLGIQDVEQNEFTAQIHILNDKKFLNFIIHPKSNSSEKPITMLENDFKENVKKFKQQYPGLTNEVDRISITGDANIPLAVMTEHKDEEITDEDDNKIKLENYAEKIINIWKKLLTELFDLKNREGEIRISTGLLEVIKARMDNLFNSQYFKNGICNYKHYDGQFIIEIDQKTCALKEDNNQSNRLMAMENKLVSRVEFEASIMSKEGKVLYDHPIVYSIDHDCGLIRLSINQIPLQENLKGISIPRVHLKSDEEKETYHRNIYGAFIFNFKEFLQNILKDCQKQELLKNHPEYKKIDRTLQEINSLLILYYTDLAKATYTFENDVNVRKITQLIRKFNINYSNSSLENQQLKDIVLKNGKKLIHNIIKSQGYINEIVRLQSANEAQEENIYFIIEGDLYAPVQLNQTAGINKNKKKIKYLSNNLLDHLDQIIEAFTSVLEKNCKSSWDLNKGCGSNILGAMGHQLCAGFQCVEIITRENISFFINNFFIQQITQIPKMLKKAGMEDQYICSVFSNDLLKIIGLHDMISPRLRINILMDILLCSENKILEMDLQTIYTTIYDFVEVKDQRKVDCPEEFAYPSAHVVTSLTELSQYLYKDRSVLLLSASHKLLKTTEYEDSTISLSDVPTQTDTDTDTETHTATPLHIPNIKYIPI